MSRTCSECYWKLSNCPFADQHKSCRDFYPNDYDDSFTAPEPEYEVNSDDVWGRNGFTVLTGGDIYSGTEAIHCTFD